MNTMVEKSKNLRLQRGRLPGGGEVVEKPVINNTRYNFVFADSFSHLCPLARRMTLSILSCRINCCRLFS